MVLIRKLHLFVEEILTGVLFLFLVIITFINVIMRYFIGNSVPGIVELSGLTFIWVCMIGSSLAFKHNFHITVDLVINRIPEKYRNYYQSFIYVVSMALFVFVIYYGTLFAMQAKNNSLGILPVSQAWLYAALPAGFALMFIRLLIWVISVPGWKRR